MFYEQTDGHTGRYEKCLNEGQIFRWEDKV